MAVLKEKEIIKNSVQNLAQQIVVAVRTAPKARGLDNIAAVVITENEIISLSDVMKKIGNSKDVGFFIRDAQNLIDGALAVVIIGCQINPVGLKYCGLCGFENCDEKNNHPNTPCVFNVIDLGIALGSAVSKAADLRLDNRIMYTIGMAARELNFLDSNYNIMFGIPLSASSKNPFFDRQ
ncbi:MAG: ferredoxin [Bacteroidetes bacterium]|nr:ferredoxin [Bacteroidota bacterium]